MDHELHELMLLKFLHFLLFLVAETTVRPYSGITVSRPCFILAAFACKIYAGYMKKIFKLGGQELDTVR